VTLDEARRERIRRQVERINQLFREVRDMSDSKYPGVFGQTVGGKLVLSPAERAKRQAEDRKRQNDSIRAGLANRPVQAPAASGKSNVGEMVRKYAEPCEVVDMQAWKRKRQESEGQFRLDE
jgi:hypothetical protein